MKICHMTSVHSSKDPRIFFKECTSLAKAGYDVYLVAPGESREENGVHVIGVGAVPQSRYKRMMAFSKKVYTMALALDAGIYHLHDPELLPYVEKLKHHGKKVIFDSHENTLHQMSDKSWIPSLFRPVVSTLYTKFARRRFSLCDALISVTPHIVEELRSVNPNTWIITNYPICCEPLQKEERGGFSFCFTGGIEEQWSHGQIVTAISGIEDVEYTLCGIPDASYLRLLQTLDGWKHVHYLGMVTHNEALSVQRRSYAGIGLLKQSSNTDGSNGSIGNTKIFEYMMSGIPVICTNFASWREIVDKWHCGIYVDPNDVDAIATAIRYLCDHPDEAQQMGQNGRRAVEEEYNWSSQEMTLLERYGEIAG